MKIFSHTRKILQDSIMKESGGMDSFLLIYGEQVIIISLKTVIDAVSDAKALWTKNLEINNNCVHLSIKGKLGIFAHFEYQSE